LLQMWPHGIVNNPLWVLCLWFSFQECMTTSIGCKGQMFKMFALVFSFYNSFNCSCY
jgi:hypothetical protein